MMSIIDVILIYNSNKKVYPNLGKWFQSIVRFQSLWSHVIIQSRLLYYDIKESGEPRKLSWLFRPLMYRLNINLRVVPKLFTLDRESLIRGCSSTSIHRIQPLFQCIIRHVTSPYLAFCLFQSTVICPGIIAKRLNQNPGPGPWVTKPNAMALRKTPWEREKETVNQELRPARGTFRALSPCCLFLSSRKWRVGRPVSEMLHSLCTRSLYSKVFFKKWIKKAQDLIDRNAWGALWANGFIPGQFWFSEVIWTH